jgi:hypothetical protein
MRAKIKFDSGDIFSIIFCVLMIVLSIWMCFGCGNNFDEKNIVNTTCEVVAKNIVKDVAEEPMSRPQYSILVSYKTDNNKSKTARIFVDKKTFETANTYGEDIKCFLLQTKYGYPILGFSEDAVREYSLQRKNGVICMAICFMVLSFIVLMVILSDKLIFERRKISNLKQEKTSNLKI